ncbi:MAG: hypothetical protein K2Z81_18765 [Cyanobacteria bacterium]|nr:hypothetical protein [Cyanobacteriota bacterium]
MVVGTGPAILRQRDFRRNFDLPIISALLFLIVSVNGAFAAQEGGTIRPRQSISAPSIQRSVSASMFTVEGEDLVKAGKIQTSSGKAVVQRMNNFGQGWSQNEQLFWTGGAVGATLDLIVEVPVAATYAVELYMTRAPDYADFLMEIDGKPSSLKFSGYTPNVMSPNPMQVGNFPLQSGMRKLSLLIVGKYPQGTGYLVGIDRIVFYPSGPIAPTQQADVGTQPAGPTVAAGSGPGPLAPTTKLEVWDGLLRVDNVRLYQNDVFIDRNRKDLRWWFRWSTSMPGTTGAMWQVLWQSPPSVMEGWKSPPGLADRGLVPNGVPPVDTFHDFDLDVKPWVWAPLKAGQMAPPIIQNPQFPQGPALKPKDMAGRARTKPGAQSRQDAGPVQGTMGQPSPGGVFYVRVVPLNAQGEASGPPSLPVKISYGVPKKDGDIDVTITSAGLGFPAARFTGYTPGQAPVWMSWCYQVATRDMQLSGISIKKGAPNNACKSSGDSFDPLGSLKTIVKLGGMTVDLFADIYNGAKGNIVSAVASVLKDTVGCGQWCEKALETGLTIAMTSVGLPPSMTDFDQLVANGKDYLASQVAAELAKNSPVPLTEDLAKKAAEKAIEEFANAAKSQASGSGAPLWVPDPTKQYQPLVLIVHVKGQTSPVSSPATIVLSQAGGGHYKTKSIPLPSLKKDQEMTIPVVMPPTFPVDAWLTVYPFGSLAGKCPSPNSLSDNPGALPPPPGFQEEAKQKAAQKAYQECQQKAAAEYSAKLKLAQDLFSQWTTKYTQGPVTFRVDAKNSGGQEWAMDKVICSSPLGGCQVPKLGGGS